MKTPRFFHIFSAAALSTPVAASADSVPDDLAMNRFSTPAQAPCPACLCVAGDGTVFAGVDLHGSLGKGPGKGRIVRLADTDGDGVADARTVFARVDNPRGLISVGDKLYVLHTAYDKGGDKSTGMDLVVFQDADGDGVADGAAEMLVKDICSASSINKRGTDHSTNGIRMGIDGWIYIAVGDFGFAGATDREGTELTLLGGGIVRVRPDGTEMELFTTGMRNIYDMAIDPFMNIFTRGNTNDGGGWNVRFNHHIQSAEYGYPRLFKNFTDETLPALADVGGGSGVGALFLDDPAWPEAYNHQPLMADWGRSEIIIHRVTPDGPTFTQDDEKFIAVNQVTDLDIDTTGQMFISAWNGAGFTGDKTKGYIVRVVPKGWVRGEVPDFAGSSTEGLVAMMKSERGKTRLLAQQELLTREDSLRALPALETIIGDTAIPKESRVAAAYTFAQIETDPDKVFRALDKEGLREFALRASTDRLPRLKDAELPLAAFTESLHAGSPRERAAAAIAIGRIGDPALTADLLTVPFTKSFETKRELATTAQLLKKNRLEDTEISIDGGEPLFINTMVDDDQKGATHIALIEPKFILEDGSTVPLSSLKPVAGEFYLGKNPDGSELKQRVRGKKGREVLTFDATESLTYTAPENAVRFRSKFTRADSSGEGTEFQFFLSVIDPSETEGEASTIPAHATPNSGIVLPHLAARSLMKMGDADALLSAIGSSEEDLALWVLSYRHEPKVVDSLLAKYPTAEVNQEKLLEVLGRLYNEEAPYDGSWWWSTRPDTRGPYYKPVTWESSRGIEELFLSELQKADEKKKTHLASLNDRMRMKIDVLGTLIPESAEPEQPTVDLAKITSQKGAIGSTPIEDVILSLPELKGDLKNGEMLFARQGCVACHALEQGGTMLGPYMGQIGSIMNSEQIATAILRPDYTISQGFQTAQVKTKDGTMHMGFVTSSDTDTMVLRNMAGQATTLKQTDVESEEHLPNSMMPAGLANALSLQEFADLVSFLESKKQ